MAEQSPIPEPSGEFRQRLDLQQDSISAGGIESPICAGVRLSVYAIKQHEALFYGQRIIFRARLNAPRNFRNPGAFDYKAYLSEHGITALASVPRSGITVISGFAGSWLELVRVRARRSVLQKVDELWPPGDASLMDAMVAGEDAFISRSTRTDFQRSGCCIARKATGRSESGRRPRCSSAKTRSALPTAPAAVAVRRSERESSTTRCSR